MLELRAKRGARSPKGQIKAAGAVREGSKTAQVVAMLQRKNGATLAEIMDKMGWQKHTVRGFMAGAMKKAGYTVESFNPRAANVPTGLTSSIKRIPPSFQARPALPWRAFLLLVPITG